MSYDAIVLGCGGVGSAALFHLARRGQRVLGIDRFEPAHGRGSSHGHTRIIRQAYFEHADYVPLLRRTYELWRELEVERSADLFHEVGLVEVGPPDGVVVPGVLAAARRYQLPVELLETADAHARFPGFRFPGHMQVVFERRAGYLLVEQCVQAHLDSAIAAGADYLPSTPVVRWRTAGDSVTVQTERDEYSAAKLVVAAGAWTRQILQRLGVPLRVVRKHLHWYGTQTGVYQGPDCPAFFYEVPEGYYYGFPQIDRRGVKLAEHSGGDDVDDPTNVDRRVDAEERGRVSAFAGTYLPRVSGPINHHTVCMYTMSPDEHFIVDRHPEYPQVVFAAGLSGHGFKFACVLGEVLAQLAVEGRTPLPIEFLRCGRFNGSR